MARTLLCTRTLIAEPHRARRVRGASPLRRLIPALAALAAFVVVMLASATAEARSIRLHNPRPEEVDGKWKLKFTVNYGKIPPLAHIPMVFHFQHVKKYEWAFTEQSPEKAVFTTKPLVNQPEIAVPVDVGFANASGEMFKITKMTVPIRRDPDMGFEAGEYKLTVRESGRVFGRPMRITFKGKNKPIDRRPITFQAKPVGPKKGGSTDPPGSGQGGHVPFEARDQGDVMVDESEMEGLDDDEPDGPPAEKPKQGGCGCRLAGSPGAGAGLAAFGLLLLGVATGARRRLWRLRR